MAEAIRRQLFRRFVESGADRCQGISERACDKAADNFFRIVSANFLTKLGDAIASPKITLAWILGAVGAPAYLVGLLVPIRESGSLLPQLLIAGFIARLPLRKHVWVAGALVQALAIAGMGITAIMLDGLQAGWVIVALLVVFSLARGFSSISSKDVLGKTIPKAQRGQTTGWAAGAAGLATIGLGVFLIVGVGRSGDATLYGSLVVAAGGLWVLAAGVFARIAEFEGETRRSDALLRNTVARLDLLRQDAVFRRFVMTRALLLCTALSAPYYVSLAQDALGSPASLLGTFIVASGLASLLSSPVWGRFADRSSRWAMVSAAATAAALGMVVFAIAVSRPEWLKQAWLLPLLYFLLSVTHQGARVGRKTYIVDIAEGNRRTDYVAVSNTVIGAVLLLTGVLGTFGAVFSVPAVILVLSLLGLAGAALGLRLPEA